MQHKTEKPWRTFVTFLEFNEASKNKTESCAHLIHLSDPEGAAVRSPSYVEILSVKVFFKVTEGIFYSLRLLNLTNLGELLMHIT